MTLKDAHLPHRSMADSHLTGQALPVSGSQPPLQTKSRHGVKVPAKKIIRDLGLKVTTQRLLILDIVRNGPNHFTAQDIFESVGAQNPAIGFATVYRFLRTLSENDFVTEVRLGGMPARYEWAAKKHHDHLTCVVCAKIVEFENPEIERLQNKVAKEFGFQLTDHVLELYGTCAECRQKAPAQDSGSEFKSQTKS
jgi:Fur family ferric uptake transcriptional regulator